MRIYEISNFSLKCTPLNIPNKVHQYSAAKYTTYYEVILSANCA